MSFQTKLTSFTNNTLNSIKNYFLSFIKRQRKVTVLRENSSKPSFTSPKGGVIRPAPQTIFPGKNEEKTVIRPASQTIFPGKNEGKTVIRPAPALIKPAELMGPAFEMKDLKWEQKGSNYLGYFSDNVNIYEGGIKWNVVKKIFDPYIRNPPKNVFIGQHNECFHKRNDGWYWIHLNHPSSDPVSTLRIVEDLLRNPL